MLAKAVLLTPKDSTIIFDLEDVIGFYDASSGNTDVVNIYLARYSSTVGIMFTFAEFEQRFLKYKRGHIDDSDMVEDEDGNPIRRMLRFYDPDADNSAVNPLEVLAPGIFGTPPPDLPSGDDHHP